MALLPRRERRPAQLRWPFPDLSEMMEWPMLRPRPFGSVIRIEDCVAGGRYLVRAELPGLDPDRDIEIALSHGVLDIRAERSEETRERHRTEFRYGTLHRSILLPRGANEEDVKATYKNGVLEVSIGLAEERQGGHRISIEKQG